MSVEKIFGGWDTKPTAAVDDRIVGLWHELAAQKVGTEKQVNNSGLSQRRHEITMLWSLFQRVNPKVILEIGVAQGGTFASWCQLASDDALIIGVDRDVNDCRPREGEPVHPGIALNYLPRMTAQGGGMHMLGKRGQTIVPVNGWSHDEHVIVAVATALGGRGVEWLFHDGSHSREMFAKDFSIYWPMVADGGVFAVHDVMPSKVAECNKSEEWARIKVEETYSACYEFFSSKTDDSMGIGVLIR